MEFEIIENSSGIYLRITGEAEDCFGDELVCHRTPEGILPMRLHKVDGEKEYIYDLSGVIPLKKYFSEHPLTQREVREILEAVFDSCSQAEQYLMDTEHLVIDPEYLFFSPARKKWKIPYCGGYKKGVMTGTARVLECLMEYMDGEDKKLCQKVYGLHGMAQRENCHLQDLLAGITQEEKRPERQIETVEEIRETKRKPEENRRLQSKKISPPKWLKNPANSYVYAGIAGAAGFLVILYAYRQGIFLDAVTKEVKWDLLGIVAGLWILVIGFAFYKIHPEREEQIRWDDEMSGEPEKVCLVPQTPGRDMIFITEFPAMAGDYLQVKREGAVIYVINKESPREIYVKGSVLVPWKREIVKDGDMISFGTEEYVIEIS